LSLTGSHQQIRVDTFFLFVFASPEIGDFFMLGDTLNGVEVTGVANDFNDSH